MSTENLAPGYRELLRLPHAARLFAAALVGRLSFATVSLSLLLTVQRSTGSYAAAGAAVGAFGLTNVLISPHRARWVDRRGQRVTLPRLAAGYALLVAVLAALALVTVPAWVLIVLAGTAGFCPPPLGAAMRSLWTHLVAGPQSLARAYSLDAVGEELLFVTGPVLVGAAVVVVHPAVTLIGTGLLALAGTLAMTRGPITVAPHSEQQTSATRIGGPFRRPGFRPLLLLLVAVGVVLGTVEVAIPATAQSRGHPGLTGPLLALLSAGSAVGGLVYGRRNWRLPLPGRLLLLVAGLIAITATLAAARTNTATAGLLLLAGLFLAPSLVTGYLLADTLTPPAVRMEASTWVSTASNAGAALAAAAAGALIDRYGASTTILTGATLATVCALLASSRTPVMLNRSRQTRPQGSS